MKSDWSYDSLLALVTSGAYEDQRFDFCEQLHTQRPDSDSHNAGIRKAITCFANSDGGGTVFFGVADRKSKKSGADRLVGIDCSGDVLKELQDKLNAIEPPVHFQIASIPLEESSRCVLAAVVPPSFAVHQADGRFFARTAGGSCEPMPWARLNKQMLFNQVRCGSLQRLHIFVAHGLENTRAVEATGLGLYARLDYFDEESLRSAIDAASAALLGAREVAIGLQSVLEGQSEINRIIRHCYSARGANPFANARYERVMPALVGQTEAVLDLIGQRLVEGQCE